MEKTLIRWHIGNTPSIGLQILNESIHQIQRLYPEFDCIVCTNGKNPHLLNNNKNSNIPQILEQKNKNSSNFPFVFSAEDWKLCPPRLRLNAHEIIIDNDLVITEKLLSIEKFLDSDLPMCLEAVHRAYGQFEEKIPQNVKLNSGLYGFPPGFDFQQKLFDLWEGIDSWESRYDEQGSVVAVISGENHIVVPMTEVLPLGQGAEFTKGSAYHFIHANKGESLAWREYQNKRGLNL